MKKFRNLLLMGIFLFLITGCVKYNVTMDIKKDKSMDFSIIYAMDKSMLGDEELLKDDNLKSVKEKGFTVSEYSEDNMKGFTLSKKIKNIDEVSSDKDASYSLSGVVSDEDSKDEYLFKVKKGLLKNTYTAEFKFDSSDSSTTTSSSDDDDDDFFTSDDDDWSFGDDSLTTEDDDDDDYDYSSLASSMDLKFKVTLPYAAKSSNATSTNNDGKELSWDLSSVKSTDSIKFEFELYNMTTIYALIGGAILLVVIIIVLIICLAKKKNKKDVAVPVAKQIQ